MLITLGGAEKLIVSLGLALKDKYRGSDANLDHDVTLYTTHHDQSHCFEETLDPG